ncbi:hypothetical protein ACF08B_37370 [Streptomyces sp. NPDC015139]|uniref:hypothetical protein n=1 Tax=Streptomyces sp. NPDC015139 TaxID=3364942 RepID=UPI0036F669B7
MPEGAKQLVLSARAELITTPDSYCRGIDADGSLPLADLAGGRGWLIFTFIRRHADPQITVTDAFWA